MTGLPDEAARREAWLTAATDVAVRLSGSLTGTPALQVVADGAREASGADAAWMLSGHEPQDLRLRVVSGLPPPSEEVRGLVLDHSLSAQVWSTGRPVLLRDVGDGTHRDHQRVADRLGWPRLGAALLLPVGAGDEIEGVLGVGWFPEHADVHRGLDLRLPSRFAERAGRALQVARTNADQRRLAVLEDRERIGRDLHDLVIQRLYAIGLSLQVVTGVPERPEVGLRVTQAVGDLDAAIKDLRRSIFALASDEGSADVQSEVTRLVDRAAATLKCRPSLRFAGPVRSMIDPEVVPDLLAVLREALSNVARHADASVVDVVLEMVVAAERRVVLTVADDGRGLGDDVVPSGLGNLRERAERRGGSLAVTSSPTAGTSLRWSVPA